MPLRDEPKSIEDAQRELERLRREIDRSREECERLRDENAHLERECERLRREIERLTAALEAARRAGTRQAAPFSKGAPTARSRPPGRRAGRRHGRHAHRQPPAAIDERIDVPLPEVRSNLDEPTSVTHISQCTLCEAHCGIHVTVTDDQVEQVIIRTLETAKLAAMPYVGNAHEDRPPWNEPGWVWYRRAKVQLAANVYDRDDDVIANDDAFVALS